MPRVPTHPSPPAHGGRRHRHARAPGHRTRRHRGTVVATRQTATGRRARALVAGIGLVAVLLLTDTSSAVGGTTTALAASYVVIDRPTNTVLAASDPEAPFRAASVVKLLIALVISASGFNSTARQWRAPARAARNR